jgi:ankyrin repeat protein
MLEKDNTKPPIIPATSLVDACSQEDISMVTHLIQEGVAINSTSELGFSALNIAVFKNNIELVHILIKAGVDVNFQNTAIYGIGEPALISAIKEKNTDIIKLLLEHGADPNLPDYFGKTPLMIAAQENALEAAKMLLAHKAVIEYGIRADFYTETILCTAVLSSHTDMVTFLIKNKAKTKPLRKLPRNKIHPKMIKWLKQRKYL